MAVTTSEIVAPLTPLAGYLVVTRNASTDVLTAVDGIVYGTQAAAKAALIAASADDVATTIYLILRVDAVGGILATVT